VHFHVPEIVYLSIMNYQDKTKVELIKELQKLQFHSEIMKNLIEGINLIRLIDEVIVFTNPKFDEMFGYEPGELVGKPVYVLNAPSGRSPEETKQNIVDSVTRTGEWHGEILNIKKNGDNFWCHVNVSKFDHPEFGEVYVSVHSDITEQKKTEEGIKQALEWQQAIFEGSRDAIFISDQDSRFVAVNNAACDLTGYSREKLIKMNIPDIHDLPDLKAHRKYHRRIFEGEEILSEAKILRSDGTKIDTEFNNKLVSIGGKNYMHTTARDITVRKQNEDILRKSEAEHRSLFENSMMAISLANPEGGIIRINKAYADLYGYPDTTTMLNEVTKDTKALYANPHDRKKVLEILDKNGYMKPTEFELIRKNGEKFWALVSVKKVLGNSGKLIYLQAEHIDITDLKNTQEALRESNERHRLIMENSGLGIAYYSVNGEILMLNQVALKNLGGKSSDYIGKNLTEVFGNERGNVFIDRLKTAAISETPVVFEDYIELDGVPGWYLSTQSKILNQNGEVDGIQVIADNITELKITENKLKESQKKYRNLSLHLGEIMEKERSIIAMNLHDDLGQKLTALDLDLAWTRGRIGVQSPSVKNKLSEMHLIINEIIENIKEISSFLRPSVLFDLGLFPAISSLLDKFEKQSGIKCQFQSGTEEINVADNISLIIYRVLQEALTNIARHSGATVSEINIFLSKSKIEMIIKDNGKGIEKEQINSLTSMGITGIKERVKSVAGKLKIIGRKDSGTTILVTIPLIQFNND
jgi:PAS domain S-box-containing protein